MPCPGSAAHPLSRPRRRAGLLLLAAFVAVGPARAEMTPDERRSFADGLYARDLYEMAAREYAGLTNIAPDYAEMDVVLFRLGESYRRLNDTRAAEDCFVRLSAQFPSSAHRFKAEFRRAEMYVAREQHADAARLLEDLLGRSPPADIAAAARYNLGYALARSGRRDEAEKVLRSVIEAYADTGFYSYACLELAGLYGDQERRRSDAEALYAKAAQKPATPRVAAEALFQGAGLAFRREAYDESARGYERLLKEYPDDVRAREARLQAAWSYYHTDRPGESLDLAVAGLGDAAAGDAADWLYLKGNCERRLKQTEAAEATYDRLLKDFPDSTVAAAAAYERALIAFRAGDHATAIRLAGSVPHPGPEIRDDLHWLLAESHEATGNADEAARYYRLIVESETKGERVAEASFRLARLAREKGQLAEASAMFRGLAAEHAKHKLAPQALFESAYCQAKAGNRDEALRDWSALAERYPENPLVEEALYQKASAEAQMGHEADAAKTFALLVKKFPETSYGAQAKYWLGMMSDKGGRLEEAEKSLREALTLKPDAEWDARIKYHLATVLQRRGAMDEAAGMLQELVGLPFGGQMPPELLEWLANYRLERDSFQQAAQAAERLAANAGESAWKQIGNYLLGRARQGEGKARDARSAFEKAASEKARTRDGAEAALQLGMLLLEAKDARAAAKAFEQAAERASGGEWLDVRARSYYGLGRAAEASGDLDAASRYYLSVAVLFDDAELVPECLSRAGAAFDRLGRTGERDKTLKELKQRYPESPRPASNTQ